ncbi:M23 family metallopeptidase [uncultured Clostridium sp.]|uniref:murein hydrolase activator EnvC family protein n=1 Tax=uncultured Clostridium sp. TaxID=59620 RepID=UPI00261EAAF2|nr:M23 family metallopeptidase [uncultured Clostridium sp.]
MIKKKIGALILAGCLATPFLGEVVAFADTNKENQIEQNKNKINELEKDKEKIDGEKEQELEKLSEIMKEIESKTKNLDKYQSEVDKYQKEIDKINGEISALENKITDLGNKIAQTEEKITNNEEEKKVREEILGQRLSNYYKIDMNAQFLHMLFSSNSVGEFFSTLFNIEKIIKTDQTLITEIKELTVQLGEEKKSLEANRKEIEESKVDVEKSREEQQSLQDKALVERDKWQKEVGNLESIENEKREVLSKLENQKDSIDSKIGDLMDFNADLQKQIDTIFDTNINKNSNNSNNNSNSSSNNNSSNNGSTGQQSSGGYVRPSSYSISSQYGPRVHPVTGNPNGFHTGTDFAAPQGATTVAAKSGTVVYSGWMSGYGNTIVIDHGSGVQTLYAHSTKLLVSNGQQVSTGQAIALVGSTGMSTGPHLHFEVRINGRHTNPMNYIS